MTLKAETDVLIIGTGFSGLGMGIRLRQAGLHDFIILEQADDVGGTWRDNHYPGVACDVPSHLYSFSFEPNPNWSRLFAEQQEILAYLRHCADKYGVRSHIRFRTSVNKAIFDEQRGRWQVSTSDGQLCSARVLVSACGGLRQPVFPDIPGIERFSGKTFHTARWDHDYPLEGKTVAVVGTGASAIQLVPSIVSRVKQLELFQRTPPWILAKPDTRIGSKQKQRFAKFPWLQRLIRWLIYALLESRALGFSGLLPRMQKRTEQNARQYLQEQVRDPALRARLTPDYRIGCKRILIANDYYAALQRGNARLVTDGIREIREHAIVTTDGREHPVDAIVFATGFEAAEHVASFEIKGRNGLDLNASWRDGAEAYLGATVAGFPNLFLITGPNTGLGHNSMVFMIESQIRYVMDALRAMRERNLRWVEVKRRVQAAYNKRLHERLARSVWATGGCVSWYRTRTGKNTTLWPGFTFEFRWRTRRFDVESYLQTHEQSSAERARANTESERPGHLPVREDRPQL
jgi:cation diffusion facilitator CzcD-associated flavoprotein CzcO